MRGQTERSIQNFFKGTSKEQTLGTPGHRYQDKMIMGLRERQCESVNRN